MPAPWNETDLKAYLRRWFRPARMSIEALEALLEDDEEMPLEILPNGEIRELGNSRPEERRGKKPLTMREDLGGEYAAAA